MSGQLICGELILARDEPMLAVTPLFPNICEAIDRFASNPRLELRWPEARPQGRRWRKGMSQVDVFGMPQLALIGLDQAARSSGAVEGQEEGCREDYSQEGHGDKRNEQRKGFALGVAMQYGVVVFAVVVCDGQCPFLFHFAV